jgi:hypothetical protein
METAGCWSERRGTPTPHDEVENNSMWPVAHRPQGVVGAGQTPGQVPVEASLFPRRRGSASAGNGTVKHGADSGKGLARAKADGAIVRAVNTIVRANMAASTHRALRAPTKARWMVRALKTRKAGRIARREWEVVQTHFHFAHFYPPVRLSCARPLPTRRGSGANVRTRLSRRSSFSDLMLAGPVPVRARRRLRPWRRHTLVWSPFGGALTQAGVKA